MTDGITHNNFGEPGVAPTKHPETLTYTKYNITEPVSVQEDTEATELAIRSLSTAMQAKMLASYQKGWGGWNRREECSIIRLVDLLDVAVMKGDIVDIANFAMMLHGRGVTNIHQSRLESERLELSRALHELAAIEISLHEQRHNAISTEATCLLDELLDTLRSEQHSLEQQWAVIAGQLNKGA